MQMIIVKDFLHMYIYIENLISPLKSIVDIQKEQRTDLANHPLR